MSASWAKPGVKVVCINDAGLSIFPKAPVAGAVYTVASYDGTFISIEEIRLDATRGGRPSAWAATRFRPIVTRSQSDDVRLIKSLLVGVGEDA